MDTPDERSEVRLRSRQRWFWIAFFVTVIAPPGGVILGFAFLSEPDLRREGKMIVALSIPWTLLNMYFVSQIMGMQ